MSYWKAAAERFGLISSEMDDYSEEEAETEDPEPEPEPSKPEPVPENPQDALAIPNKELKSA